MKLVHNTPNLLIAETRSTHLLIGCVLCGLLTLYLVADGVATNNNRLLVSGLILGAVSVILLGIPSRNFLRITLDRKSGIITIKTQDYFNRFDTDFNLSDLLEANTKEALNLRYNKPRTIRGWYVPQTALALLLGTSDPPEVFVVPCWPGGDSKAVVVANAINAWLSLDIDLGPRQA